MAAAATLAQKCYFSGYNIYPGSGITYIRTDSKAFTFASKKTKSFFLRKRNPRKISWTAAYRTVHKKGISAAAARRRARRTVKAQRAIVGASLEQIKAKKAQTPAFRQAQREAAVREAKLKAKEVEKKKTAKKTAAAKKAAPVKAAPQKNAAARHGGKGR